MNPGVSQAVLAHVSIHVSDLTRSRAFYDRVLYPLGLRRLSNSSDSSGYGIAGRLQFWIAAATSQEFMRPSELFHIAFRCKDRAVVRDFFVAASEVGATIESIPELQPEYSESYYAAYIKDPDGYRIEAMTYSLQLDRAESSTEMQAGGASYEQSH